MKAPMAWPSSSSGNTSEMIACTVTMELPTMKPENIGKISNASKKEFWYYTG